jgi:hypothetical protein
MAVGGTDIIPLQGNGSDKRRNFLPSCVNLIHLLASCVRFPAGGTPTRDLNTKVSNARTIVKACSVVMPDSYYTAVVLRVLINLQTSCDG